MESILSWSKRAKCVNEGIFQEDILTKKYCTGCPVKGLCNTYAIVHDERGIWGGTVEKERKAVDPFYKNLLKQMFQEAGLLENRSLFFALGHLMPQEKLQQEHNSPNAEPGYDEGPKLSQSA